LPSPYRPKAKDDITSVEAQLFLSNSIKDAREIFEKEFIKRKLIQHSNNVTKTAEAIGVQRSHLYKRLKKLNLTDVIDETS